MRLRAVAELTKTLSSIIRLPRIMPIALARSTTPEEASRPSKRVKLDSPGPSSLPTASEGQDFAATSQASSSAIDDTTFVEEQMSLPLEYTKSYKYELNYRDKLVLAPMVRSGTLPTRLLSLYYGAGLVWSPEIVDRAIIGAERTVDPVSGVITYSKGQGPIFTTHPIEKPFLIFQIGSSDPELAVKAAKIVAQDVSGIDLNCGCPKPFSTHAGMGAALLSTPDLLLNILRALLDAIPLPISCKIRMFPSQLPTLALASRILRTGIRNLTVHCRTRDMRSSERAMWERLGDIVELGNRRKIPVICNGDGEGWANWEKIRSATGSTSLMIARAAERNPSVFQPSGPECTTTVIVPQLLNIAQYTDNSWGNTKFLLMQFKPSPAPISKLSKQEKKEATEAASRAKSLEEAATKLNIELGKGCQFMVDLESRLKTRPEYDIWAERHRAEERGEVIDPPDIDGPGIDKEAVNNDNDTIRTVPTSDVTSSTV